LVAVADADRFAQILSNLLENALGFARHRVVVRGDVQGPLVVVTVTDDGPGIPSAQLAQVFTPHFTTDRGRRRDRGSGLGLAIVAELAEAMGGGARAESPADDAGGTRMVVWLPLARQG
jgi:signal transduction histidine kinase